MVKNILLVGRTGHGKSSLANVLVNKNENFEEVFKESASSSSETKNIQSKEFKYQENQYRVIDTIGMGDTKLGDEEVLCRLLEVYYECSGRLDQVLFVIGDRITREEIKIYNIMRKSVLGNGVSDYTTIIRTKFTSFRDPKRCKDDVERVKEGNEKIAKLVNSCKTVIHVDNPSLSPRDFDEEEIAKNKKRREDSRAVLLDHLESCQNSYSPTNLGFIDREFREKMDEIRQLKIRIDNSSDEDEVKKLKRDLEEIREKITGSLTKEREKIKKGSFKYKTEKILRAVKIVREIANDCTHTVRAVVEVIDYCNQM